MNVSIAHYYSEAYAAHRPQNTRPHFGHTVPTSHTTPAAVQESSVVHFPGCPGVHIDLQHLSVTGILT